MLKALNDDGEIMYKYGCTTLDINKRLSKINSTNKYKLKFEIIAYYESKDIFGDECKVKWRILPFGLGFLGEFMPEYPHGDVCVVSNFRKILEHCKEVENGQS